MSAIHDIHDMIKEAKHEGPDAALHVSIECYQ